MDCEKLINCVQVRNALWYMADKNYHMRHVHRKLWDEVGQDMKEDECCMQRRKLQGSTSSDEEFVDDIDVVNVIPKKSVEPECSAQLSSSTPKKTLRLPKKFLKIKIKSKSTDEKFLKT
ncbi:hypothetical protein PGB90_005817 [Kerria lacca]